MDLIHQIYCTHCTHGTSALERETGALADQVLGYSVRASSFEGDELRKWYRQIEPWLYYYLPRGGPTDARLYHTAASAPKRLFYVPSAGGLEMLGQVCYRQTDTAGRPGSYFAHALVRQRSDQQPPWSATDCLRLWEAPWWTKEDSADIGFLLKPLTSVGEMLGDQCPAIDDGLILSFLTTPAKGLFNDPRQVIPTRWRQQSPQERQRAFLDAFAGLVSVYGKQSKSLLLAVEPGMAALLLFGTLRLLPRPMLREDVGFSTFEPEPARSRSTLAATCFHDPGATALPPELSGASVYVVNTYSKDPSSSGSPIPQFAQDLLARLIQGGWQAVEQASNHVAVSRAEDRTETASSSVADRTRTQAPSPAVAKPAAATAPPPESPPRPAVASEECDPYHKWLGISPSDQPPHHYRLLGIDLFESDRDVVAHAADQRMSYVRTYQTGPHASLSQRILNEIAAARVCLLKPAKKAVYDEQLRQILAARIASLQATKGIPKLPAAEENGGLSFASSPRQTTLPRSAPAPARSAANKRFPTDLWIIASVTSTVVALLGVLLGRLTSTGLPSRDTVAVEDQRAIFLTPESRPREAPSYTPSRSKGRLRTPDPHPEPPAATAGGDTIEDGMASATAPEPDANKIPSLSLEQQLPLPEQPSGSPQPAGSSNGERAATAGQSIAPVPLASPPGVRMPGSHVGTTAQPSSKADSLSRPDLPGRPARQPVPSQTACQEAMEAAKERYRDGYKSAKTMADRKALAKVLLAQASKATAIDAEKYALLTLASEMAVRAGDVATALEAADDLAAGYEVNGLELMTNALGRCAKQPHSALEHRVIAEYGRRLAIEALSQDNVEIATNASEVMLAAARRSRDTALVKAAVVARARVHPLVTVCGAANRARASLQQNPDDPEANFAVGVCLCAVQGDWDQGLPHLAEGSDEGLKSLAQREIASPPADTEGRRHLADAWWDLAEASQGLIQDLAYARAGHWYKKARSKTGSGLIRDKIDKRLDDIEDHPPPGEIPVLASSVSDGPDHAGAGDAVQLPGKTIPETIGTELRLPRRGGPYKLAARVTVGPEGKLLIERGTLVLATPGSAIIARGTINSYGDAEDFVSFRPAVPGAGWDKIELQSGVAHVVQRFDIRGATRGLYLAEEVDATIRDCLILFNQVGAETTRNYRHTCSFHNCIVANNFSDGVTVSNNRLAFERCTISGNGGIGLNMTSYGDLKITSCVISANRLGVQSDLYEAKLEIRSSNLTGNRAGAVEIKTAQDVQCKGNYWGTADPQQIAMSIDDGRRRPGNGFVVFTDFARKAIPDAGCSLRPPKERRGSSDRRIEGGNGASQNDDP